MNGVGHRTHGTHRTPLALILEGFGSSSGAEGAPIDPPAESVREIPPSSHAHIAAPPVPTISAPDPVIPPHGATLFFQDRRPRPCTPEESYIWTWSGADRWYYSSQHPPP